MENPMERSRVAETSKAAGRSRVAAVSLALSVLAAVLWLNGCAPGVPAEGLGLYSDFDAARLAAVGFPNDLDQPYWWPAGEEGEWGILYDDEGVPYGPNTYYHFRMRLDHPDLVVTDSTMTGRWFTMNRHDRSKEVMFGRWLELHDLAHEEFKKLLRYEPPMKIQIYVAPTLNDYKKVCGKDYWVMQVADGPFIAYEPMRTLWARRLALHAIRKGVALSFLDLKCHGLLPPWLRMGLASYLAEEGNVLEDYMNQFRTDRDVISSPQEMMLHIHPLYDRDTGRIAMYNAFLMSWHLAEDYGWSKVQDLLDLLEQGVRFDDAVPRVYGVSVQRLLELLDPRVSGDPTRPADGGSGVSAPSTGPAGVSSAATADTTSTPPASGEAQGER